MTDIEKKKEEQILGQEVSDSEMDAVSGGGKYDYCPLAPRVPSCKNNSMRSVIEETESLSRE